MPDELDTNQEQMEVVTEDQEISSATPPEPNFMEEPVAPTGNDEIDWLYFLCQSETE